MCDNAARRHFISPANGIAVMDDPLPKVRDVDLARHPECKDLGLIVRMAKLVHRFRGKPTRITIPDLVSIGWITARRCYHLYNPKSGIEYSTYLSRALRNNYHHAIDRTLDMINMPYAALRRKAKQDHADLGMRAVSDMVRKQAKQRVYCDFAKLYIESNDYGWADFDALHQGLNLLAGREREVISRHHGIGGCVPETFQQIGDSWGCTRQNVHVTYKTAINRLRRFLETQAA